MPNIWIKLGICTGSLGHWELKKILAAINAHEGLGWTNYLHFTIFLKRSWVFTGQTLNSWGPLVQCVQEDMCVTNRKKQKNTKNRYAMWSEETSATSL